MPGNILQALVGDWQVSSWVAWDPRDKPFLPLGLDPIGRIHYDANGSMSAILVAAQRPDLSVWAFLGDAPVDDKARAYDTVIAYFGAYEVQGDTVVHHVIGSSLPAMSGTDITRTFELEGDKLLLSFYVPSPRGEIKNELIWDRLQPRQP